MRGGSPMTAQPICLTDEPGGGREESFLKHEMHAAIELASKWPSCMEKQPELAMLSVPLTQAGPVAPSASCRLDIDIDLP